MKRFLTMIFLTLSSVLFTRIEAQERVSTWSLYAEGGGNDGTWTGNVKRGCRTGYEYLS